MCGHAQNFFLDVFVEIKIRRAPHELFLKIGVSHKFSCSLDILKNETTGWENMIKSKVLSIKLKYYLFM